MNLVETNTTTPNIGIPAEDKPKSSKTNKELRETAARHASDLFTIDNFISVIEQRYLHMSYPKFDHGPLKELLLELKTAPPNDHDEESSERAKKIDGEILKWRASLIERNQRLEAYHMRRFCDTTTEPLGRVALGVLVRFYKDLGYSHANQSKFDLFLTRFLTDGTDQTIREIEQSFEETVETIAQLFGDEPNPDSTPGSSTEEAIDQFQALINEVDEYENFEDVAKNHLFERLREHKRSLRDRLFEPRIAAMTVFTNVAVGNSFNQLLTEASPGFDDLFANDFDLSGALIDSSDEIKKRIDQNLSQVREKVNRAEDSRLFHLLELLELLCEDEEQKPEPQKASEPESSDEKSDSVIVSGKERIAHLLTTIGEAEPDRRALRDYMMENDSLDAIDLNDFLVPPEDETSQLSRSILRIILLAEEIRTNELTGKDKITSQTQGELKSILKKSQEYAQMLEEHIEWSDEEAIPRLRAVSGKLLEVGLKLKREIVKLSDRQAERSLDSIETVEETVLEEEHEEVEETPYRASEPYEETTSPLLIVMAVLLTIAAGGYYYMTWETPITPPASSLVEKIDAKDLPNGEHLVVAYRQGTMLLVTAKSSWKELTEDERKQNLEELYSIKTKQKLKGVVLTDGSGKFLGDASMDGIRMEEPEIEEADPEEF